ncbi:hypothetical protein MPSEU_001017500 [Mayamaea pseudoterrestris]|nr:hypothetical protein MPSEU_001017500 [Mayamaea pseudoterrestris]
MADRSKDSKVNPSNTDPDRPGDETVSGSVKNSSLFQDLLKDLGEVSRVHELMDILIRNDADSEDEGLKTLKLLLPHMDKQQLRELIRRGLESKHGPPIVPSTLSSPLTVEHTERAPSKRRPKGMKYSSFQTMRSADDRRPQKATYKFKRAQATAQDMTRIRILALLLLLRHTHGFVSPFGPTKQAASLRPHENRRQTRPFVISSRDVKAYFSFPAIPIIAADDTWGNWAVLTGMAASSQVLGKKTAIGRLLGPPVTAMACTFCLASVGILNPGGTVAAKSLQLLALNLATPLILLGADFRDASSRCGPLLVSFLTASAATLIACLVGWKLAGPSLTMALGRDGLAIAAALLAKNIGGGINYIAVCKSLNASPSAVAAGLCVDNIFALLYFPVTSALAFGKPDLEASNEASTVASSLPDASSTMTVQSISIVLCLSCVLIWLGEQIGGPSGSLPVCTLLTVLFASRAPTNWLAPLRQSADILGTMGLYVFFATAGAPGIAVADPVRTSLRPISVFLASLYTIHGAILFLCHKLLGRRFASFKPQRLLVASSAAIGGPATSVALAKAAGWQSLLVPSLLVGNIGYAIATFIGLAYFAVFQSR